MRHYAPETPISAQDRPLDLTIVIPTLNEAENVLKLFERLNLTLAGRAWEAIFVDDGSTDGTAETLTDLAQRDRRVRLIRRFGRRGLSSAVMEGMLASTSPLLAVIDADLQHDETILPQMLDAILSGNHDLAVGTRYASGGSIGAWASHRARISRLATRLATWVIKTPLSDPMSGFFAIRRDVLLQAAPRVSGIGYKVLLDLVASSGRSLRVAEIPYCFRNRSRGESKLDSLVALEYFEMLLDKSIGRWIPAKFILFGMVGALGLLVHLAVLALATGPIDLGFRSGQTLAVITAMTFNFFLNNRLTYRDRRLVGLGFLRGLLSFYLICSLGAVANIGIGTILFARHESWWVAGVAGAVVGSVWNYVIGGMFTWKKRP
ncbi:glycosyltransferase family 2 protein [soil metagenome]